MAEKARHAFGALENIDSAISAGTIDAYDILFVKDANGKPYVGWIDKEGQKVIVDDSAELTELEKQIATKVSADEVDAKIDAAVTEKVESTISEITFEVEKDYEVAYKPDGTLVDYRDKEVRVMCPADTQWTLQNSGEGSDPSAYYIGFKAYAPSDDIVSFKEDLAEIISDNEMYYFEGNEFAGIDADGRKYSIVWLPVAKYDDASVWTYYGASSTTEKYIGWYYSVEWYNADGKLVASDCIRINLSNENCHSSIEPYYVGDMMSEIDTKIEKKVAEVSAIEVIEF